MATRAEMFNKIKELISKCNTATGQSDTDLETAVNHLLASSGGGCYVHEIRIEGTNSTADDSWDFTVKYVNNKSEEYIDINTLCPDLIASGYSVSGSTYGSGYRLGADGSYNWNTVMSFSPVVLEYGIGYCISYVSGTASEVYISQADFEWDCRITDTVTQM